MFQHIAEDITFLLMKDKIIDIEKREVCTYGLETLLLNVSVIISVAWISVMTKSFWHFLAFMLVFVPLRTVVGGYHAKTSGSCFVSTLLLYGFTVFIIKKFPMLYQNKWAILFSVVLIVLILVFAPLEHEHHPLDELSYRKNKIAAVLLVIMDSSAFILLKAFEIKMALNIMLFVAVTGLLLAFEMLKRIIGKWISLH